MHISIKKNLPGFLFPDDFKASLPTDSTTVEITPALAEKARKSIFTIRCADREYFNVEIMESYFHSSLKDLRKFADGTYLARLEEWDYLIDLSKSRENYIVLRLDEKFSVLNYTFVEQKITDAIYLQINGHLPMMVPPSDMEMLYDIIKRMRSNTTVTLFAEEDSTSAMGLCLKKRGPSEYIVEMSPKHFPWKFRAQKLSFTKVCGLVRALSEKGAAGVYSVCEWEHASIYPQKGVLRNLGIRIRLVYHRYKAILDGDTKKKCFIDSLKMEESPDPCWVSLAHGDWKVMMDDLSYKAEWLPLGRRKLMMLAYAAFEGSERAKHLLEKCLEEKPIIEED